MANQILNFRDETLNMQNNIKEIEECTEKIKMVNDMRNSFLKLRTMIVTAVISLVFWIFGFVVCFVSCTIMMRIIAVLVGALATFIIFKKDGGKVSAVTIASVAVCYFIIEEIFFSNGIILIPIIMMIINAGVTFFTYKSFKKSADRIMPQ